MSAELRGGGVNPEKPRKSFRERARELFRAPKPVEPELASQVVVPMDAIRDKLTWNISPTVQLSTSAHDSHERYFAVEKASTKVKMAELLWALPHETITEHGVNVAFYTGKESALQVTIPTGENRGEQVIVDNARKFTIHKDCSVTEEGESGITTLNFAEQKGLNARLSQAAERADRIVVTPFIPPTEEADK